MIVVVDHEIGYSVDGIHREILTEGEYNFDDLPLIAREVCVLRSDRSQKRFKEHKKEN